MSGRQLFVGYDHPVHLAVDHALSIDFVNESQGLVSRVAVELSRDSAQRLVDELLETVDRADALEGRMPA